MKSITLKNSSIYILMILSLVACQSPADISGTLEGTVTKEFKIYLIQPETLRDVAGSYLGKVVDSATVASDGRFEFRNLSKTDESVLFELAIQTSGKSPNFLETDTPSKSNFMPFTRQSGETLEITAQIVAFQKSV